MQITVIWENTQNFTVWYPPVNWTVSRIAACRFAYKKVRAGEMTGYLDAGMIKLIHTSFARIIPPSFVLSQDETAHFLMRHWN
jgi:hypothetical protein